MKQINNLMKSDIPTIPSQFIEIINRKKTNAQI